MKLKLRPFGLEVFGGSKEEDLRATRNVTTGKKLLELASLAPDDAIVRLNSSLDGLDEAAAEARLAQHGLNEVAHEHHKHPVQRLFDQCWPSFRRHKKRASSKRCICAGM
jgi:magnesium-transporting ATPase (P-type)